MESRPIAFTDRRRRLIREYARIHYGREMETIVPQAVVVHWTASDSRDGVYRYFYNEENPHLRNGTLNVASHFLVDRDGTIWQLTPETALNRHAIGLNWCAIGIENVGGVDGREDLTRAQMEANVKLIRYLRGKYPTISGCWAIISRTRPGIRLCGKRMYRAIIMARRIRDPVLWRG